ARALRARQHRAPSPAARREAPSSRRRSWQKALQLVLEIYARAVESRAHRAELEGECGGDLFVREALEVAEDHHHAALLRQLGDGVVQGRFELATLRSRLRSPLGIGDPEQDLLTMRQIGRAHV